MDNPMIGAIYRRKYGRRSKMTVTAMDTKDGIVFGTSHDDGNPCGYAIDLFQKDFVLDEHPTIKPQLNDFRGLKIGSEYVNTDGSLRVTIVGYDSKLVYCSTDAESLMDSIWDYNDFINGFTPANVHNKIQFAKDVAAVFSKHGVGLSVVIDSGGWNSDYYEIVGKLNMTMDELYELMQNHVLSND